jgi:hypothetical protein
MYIGLLSNKWLEWNLNTQQNNTGNEQHSDPMELTALPYPTQKCNLRGLKVICIQSHNNLAILIITFQINSINFFIYIRSISGEVWDLKLTK